MIMGEVDDSIRAQLEHIWTDKTPDRLDPDVKRYWRWLGLINIHLFFLMFFLPFFIPFVILDGGLSVTSFGLCLMSYLILIIVAGAIIVLYSNLYYQSYLFLLTDDMILIQRGVIWNRKTVIPYNRVQNVDITHNPLERILGIATVHVHTAAIGMAYAEGKLPGIPFPDELSEIIMRKVRIYKYGSGLGDDVFGKDVDKFINKFRHYLITKEK
jgi:membrane protein YdbS with pleckstrin-like domain